MPVVALVAVAAVGVGLSVYAGAVDASLDVGDDDTTAATAATAADRAVATLAPDGVARSDRLAAAQSTLPADLRTNLTLRSTGEAWHAGPAPPSRVAEGHHGERATVPVQVRIAPGRIHTGRLTVVVWR